VRERDRKFGAATTLDGVVRHVWLTYRRSAAGARGSEATDKPDCCNA
jgi:hypothetical protein